MVVSEQELLNPTQQDAVLQDIAVVLAHNLPPGWQECLVVHGALGAHAETTVRIERLNGPPTDVAGPEVLGELFARLRTGMYRPGVGTWFSARYRLTHPVDYRIEYDNTGRPAWAAPPPPEAYADELRTFPRAPEHIPDWLLRPADDTVEDRPSGPETAPADAAAPRFQMARVFDSLGPGQTPQVDRPPVPPGEAEAIADYLTKAPLVLAARSLDNDLLDPARPATVPLTYLTDGTWIWPGGVGYYLRTHGVPPEPELVEHIRRQGFQPPEVDDYTRDVAVAAIMGQPPPSRPAPEAPAADMLTADVRAADVGAADVGAADVGAGDVRAADVGVADVGVAEPPPVERPTEGAVPPEPAAPGSVAHHLLAPPAMPMRETNAPAAASLEPEPSVMGTPPPAPREPATEPTTERATEPTAEPAQAGSAPVDAVVADQDKQALQRLRARLTELGIDPESYGVEMIVPDAWCLVREGEGWAVFRTAGGDRAVSFAFPAADQAAAFLLGTLVLAADRPRPPVAPPVTAPDIRRPARAYDGPIEPLPGEPPVTLFRNLREFELVAGTEIDRVGDPGGNLAYAAGTHYSQRSLPAEWADRPYHVYRLRQPLRVLIGTAVPWFDQPGGGTGYFLPVSVAELLADGVLIEIEPARK
ncbi:MAG TPA: glycohydrolase toxin TNT-related protein [Streptosporangiaceae bacterium]|nr:glycohydrolase toxin TNT-related protein [Streptosporangiaceae bacterium]